MSHTYPGLNQDQTRQLFDVVDSGIDGFTSVTEVTDEVQERAQALGVPDEFDPSAFVEWAAKRLGYDGAC